MRLTKAQAVVITLLNLVIAALVAFIFLSPSVTVTASTGGGDDDTPVDVPPVQTVHNKYRAATAGQVPEIVRETRLMGSGDEGVVEAFFISGYTYIFGNATVADYDFDKFGGFVCRLDAQGKIDKYAYFGAKLTAVCVMGDEFIAATYSPAADSKTALYAVSADCEIADIAQSDSGAVIELFCTYYGRLAAVSQPDTHSIKYAEYEKAESGWTLGRSTRIDSGYVLEYFDCYDFGETFVIAARAHSLPRYDSAVFFTFTPGGDESAHFYGGTGESLTTPYAVKPYRDGYIALCKRNGAAAIVSIDYAFMSYRRDMLGFEFESATIDESNGKYYACFTRTDGIAVYELDNNLSRRTLPFASGAALDIATDCDGTTLLLGGAVTETVGAAKHYGALKIVRTSDGKTLELDIDNVTVHAVSAPTGGAVVAVFSATGGNAVSAPTGGRDVYVAVIEF